MYAYFDRDNVALRGLAKYFRKVSKEEREHAEGLMDFQNRRGGRVILQNVPAPLTDFNHVEKGDALNVRMNARVARAECFHEYRDSASHPNARGWLLEPSCRQLTLVAFTQAMELALSLEKVNYAKLKALDKLAVDAEDFNLSDYVDKLLDDQTEDVKRAADYVSQLRRVGKGHGVWAWDQQLYDDYD